jgi:CHAT domain-containing protein
MKPSALTLCLTVLCAAPALSARAASGVDGPSWTAPHAESLLVEARRLYINAEWPEALEMLPDIVRGAQQSANPAHEADARTLLGACLMASKVPRQAEKEFAQARDLARQAGDRARELRALAGLGAALNLQRSSRQAFAILDEVLAAARDMGDHELETEMLLQIGEFHRRTGRLDLAVRTHEEALALATKHGLTLQAAIAIENLGHDVWYRGHADSALTLLHKALELARGCGAPGRGDALTALALSASVLVDLERYSDALVAFDEALALAQDLEVAGSQVNLRNALGRLYSRLGRPEEALEQHEMALATARARGLPGVQVPTLRLIGIDLVHLGRRDEALLAFGQAARRAESLHDPHLVAAALRDLGWAHSLRGDLDLARTCLLRALETAEKGRNPVLIGDVERTVGHILAARGDTTEALRYFDRAIERGRNKSADSLLRLALIEKAKLLRTLGSLDQADTLLAEAMDRVEMVRENLAGQTLRVDFLATEKDVYPARVGVLYEIGQIDTSRPASLAAAFHVSERARARSLLDALSGMDPDRNDVVDPALRARERKLWTEIGVLQATLSRATSSEIWDRAHVDSMEAVLKRAHRTYRATIEEISALSRAYGAFTGQRAPLALEDVQKRVLLDDELLLEYLVGPEESFLFVVSKERGRLIRIPMGADTLEARVAALRETITSARPLQDAARQLHEILLDPVIGDLEQGRHLVIVADGPLFYLPFAALHDGSRFLVERHPIRYASSASVLDPEIRKETPRREPLLVAIGNPTFLHAEELLASRRGVEDWRLGELPYAEEEVRRVAKCFRRHETMTRSEATEEATKKAISRAAYVHLATHALVNEAEPLMSSLALAQDEDPGEDGYLQGHEIMKLDLDADLVTLSACNTALGRIAEGEGVLGLTQAFTYAGARAILNTMWEVADRSTVELMASFYEALTRNGLPADLALQRAQVSLLSSGAPARDWAGFVLSGSPVILPQRASWNRSAALILGALGLILLGAAATYLIHRAPR